MGLFTKNLPPEVARSPATQMDVAKLGDGLLEIIDKKIGKGWSEGHVEALDEHIMARIAEVIDPIGERLRRIEQKGVHYRGVYQRSDEYTRGDLVTHEGSMWHCCADTTRTIPGSGNDWQLAVKAGKDLR